MAYNGSVEIISGLIAKNGMNFPLIHARSVYVSDGHTLADILNGLENVTLKDYVNEDGNNIPQEVENRLTSLENSVGNINAGDITDSQKTITGRVSILEDENINIKNVLGDIIKIKPDDEDSDIVRRTVTQRLVYLEDALGDYSVFKESGSDLVRDMTLSDKVHNLEQILGVYDADTPDSFGSIIDNERSARIEAVGELNSRVNSLEEGFSNINDIDSKINSAIDSKLAQMGSNNTDDLNEKIDDNYTTLDRRITNVENSVDNINSTVITQITPVVNTERSERIAADESHVSRIAALESKIGALSGTLITVNSMSEMKDTSARYILSTNNHWYYYDESNRQWVDSGEFGGNDIDETLTKSGSAADSKAVGDKINSLLSQLNTAQSTLNNIKAQITELTGIHYTSTESKYNSYLSVITDNAGTILAYFDEYGHFHINGNLYCENI